MTSFFKPWFSCAYAILTAVYQNNATVINLYLCLFSFSCFLMFSKWKKMLVNKETHQSFDLWLLMAISMSAIIESAK